MRRTTEELQNELNLVIALIRATDNDELEIRLAERADELGVELLTRCPGCGCLPGDGVSENCTHPYGCAFARQFA